MALLHRVRRRSRFLRFVTGLVPALVAPVTLITGCRHDVPVEDHRPDERLRNELGLTDADQVYRVTVSVQGYAEEASPDLVEIPPGAWVQFVSGDWRIHTVRFEEDSLAAASRAFLVSSDQVASQPMVDKDARFVVSFSGAPPGRYPFVVEGSAAPARGVVVVRPNR